MYWESHFWVHAYSRVYTLLYQAGLILSWGFASLCVINLYVFVCVWEKLGVAFN